MGSLSEALNTGCHRNQKEENFCISVLDFSELGGMIRRRLSWARGKLLPFPGLEKTPGAGVREMATSKTDALVGVM